MDKEKTAFFFVDDIDRATGEQIRDILSELKVYVSHPRIIVVLGYDSDYVINALGNSVLPKGTDPKKYLEKIVTLQRQLPVPYRENMIKFATYFMKTICELDDDTARSLATYAVILTSSNPRRLKNLILLFAIHYYGDAGEYLMHFINTEFKVNYNNQLFDFKKALENAFFVFIASSLGLFSDQNVKASFEIGDPALMRYALRSSAMNATKETEIKLLLTWLKVFSLGTDRILPKYDGVNYRYNREFTGLPSAMGLCQKMSVDESIDTIRELLESLNLNPMFAGDFEQKNRTKELEEKETK